jgi:hypothetical protein
MPTRCAGLLLALTSAVCLTACSTLYAKKDEPKGPQFSLTNDAHTPDIPPHLVKCIKQDAKPGKTADEMVVNRMQTDAERRACSEALLKWYKEIQAANGKPPVPERKPAAKAAVKK